jgi:soluble lytic murein transglycosylase
VPAASAIDTRSLAAILEQAGPAALDAPLLETLALSGTGIDLGAIDDWLTAEYGPPAVTTALYEELFDDISPALIEAGERVLARALALEQLDALAGAPHAQTELSSRVSELALDDVALIAAIRLLSPLPTETRLDTPIDLERLAYPAPWSELVIAASEEFAVPSLLLLALIRQESAFEPDVVSPAGAIGLTQVIPPTGVQIAAALDESWDGPASLTEPETSLRYGAAYLSAQLETFNGNMFAALDAYNAGPTNAWRWLDAQVLEGSDGYVEAIDFEETRRYVTSVVEQYAWYRYLYGAAEAPAIR